MMPIQLKINATATSVTIDGNPAVLKGDKSMVPGQWNFVNPSSGAPTAGTIMVEIDDPGQSDVKGT
jgi:uncharacterized Zn-binding protein involved in type VI secretion